MIICVETKRKTAYLCFLYFRECGDPLSRIGEELNKPHRSVLQVQVQTSRQFKSTNHDDFAFVRDRGGFKTLHKALWDHQRFTDH